MYHETGVLLYRQAKYLRERWAVWTFAQYGHTRPRRCRYVEAIDMFLRALALARTVTGSLHGAPRVCRRLIVAL